MKERNYTRDGKGRLSRLGVNRGICGLFLSIVIFFSPLLSGAKNSEKSPDHSMVLSCIDAAVSLKNGYGSEAKKIFENKVLNSRGFRLLAVYLNSLEGWSPDESKKYMRSLFFRKNIKRQGSREFTSKKWEARTRKLWKRFLKYPERYKKILSDFEKYGVQDLALRKAEKFLPGKLGRISFSIVLFGHSAAFSVGKTAAIDLLQLPVDKKRRLIVGESVDFLAHELHHIGFNHYSNLGMIRVSDRELISLAGMLASEGIPTYYIDKPFDKLRIFRKRRDMLYRKIYLDWIYNSKRIDELYSEAESDIEEGLRGNLSIRALALKWDLGVKGAVYILGSDMINVIDKYLGKERVMEIIGDYRKLLYLYNLAAEKGGKYRFRKELAEKLLRFRGAGFK